MDNFVKRPKSPCPKKCENRKVGCRTECYAWIKYEKELEIYRQYKTVQYKAGYKFVWKE